MQFSAGFAGHGTPNHAEYKEVRSGEKRSDELRKHLY